MTVQTPPDSSRPFAEWLPNLAPGRRQDREVFERSNKRLNGAWRARLWAPAARRLPQHPRTHRAGLVRAQGQPAQDDRRDGSHQRDQEERVVRYTLPTTTKAPFTTASRLAVFGPPFAGRRCRNGTAQGASSLNPGHAAFLYSSKRQSEARPVRVSASSARLARSRLSPSAPARRPSFAETPHPQTPPDPPTILASAAALCSFASTTT